jgi:hypothetical protein
MGEMKEDAERVDEPLEIDLVQTPEGLVAVPRKAVPTLTVDEVRAKLDAIRSGSVRAI